jgi:hypothetical protein
VDVSAGTKFHILTAERCDLAIAQARLYSKQQERSVSPADPGGRIWCCHQRIAFLFGYEFHWTTLIALRRNRQDALAMQCQCGFADGYVLKERMQSRQAIVPRPRTIAARTFEVFEELPQESCIEVLHPQFGGRASEALGCETEQQTEGVPIGCYGVRACAKLFLQSVGKETLDERLKAGTSHRLPPG